MADPALALQGAIVAALSGSTDADDQVFDDVPPEAGFPRITVGDGSGSGVYADCLDQTETFLTIDVWSREIGWPEAKTIASQVRGILHDASLTLDGHVLDLIEYRSTQYLRDPDGITRHAAMTFRALTQPQEET